MKNLMNLMVGMTILAAAVSAQAIVRPNGTILESACGHVNRSVMICTAEARQGGSYLVLKHFRDGNTYIPVTREVQNPGIAGSFRVIYKGRYAIEIEAHGFPNRMDVFEKKIELEVSRIIVPGAETIGVLKVDGKITNSEIIMESIAHIQ